MADKTVKAPMPGTFYRRTDSESAPYVAKGESVSAGGTIGLVQIMKGFQEIKTEEEGAVTKILVVDARKPLARGRIPHGWSRPADCPKTLNSYDRR